MKTTLNKKSTIFKASITIAAIVLLSIFAQSTFAIGASPLRMTYNAMPGETVKGQLNVRNTSDEKRKIIINKADFDVDPDKESLIFFEETSSNTRGLTKWLKLPGDPIIVEAKDKAVIPYEIIIPDNALHQGYFGTIFVESQSVDEKKQQGLGMKISTRIAHLILLEVGDNNAENIELKDINITKNDDFLNINIEMFNKECVHNAPSGELEIFGVKGETLMTMPLNKGLHHIMPERKKTFTEQISLNELKPGVNYAILKAKTAQGKDLQGEIQFEITKEKEITTLAKNLNKINGATMRQSAETNRKTINITTAVSAILIFAVCIAFITKHCICKVEKTKKRK